MAGKHRTGVASHDFTETLGLQKVPEHAAPMSYGPGSSACSGDSACSGQPGTAHGACARRVCARQIPVEFKDAQALTHATQLGHVLGDYLDGLGLLLQKLALCTKQIPSAQWAARTRGTQNLLCRHRGACHQVEYGCSMAPDEYATRKAMGPLLTTAPLTCSA